MQSGAFPLACVVALSCAKAETGKTGSPVEKVVTLLKELKDRVSTDLKDDQRSYDKYACWCETTTHRVASSIEQAKTDLRSLGQEILSLKSLVATRTAEIAELMDKAKANEEAQQEATTIRTNENQAWMAETTEMQQAVAAMESAITVLGDATQFVQLRSHAGVHEASAQRIQKIMQSLPTRVVSRLPYAKMSLLKRLGNDLMRSKESSKYAPQSATIQGILQQMYTTFAADLQDAMRDEATKNRDFEAFIAAKQEELLLMQQEIAKKEDEKHEAEALLAEATQNYDDTEKQMKSDIEFFDVTKDSCTAKSDEWSTRKKAHEDELAAIKQGLEILTSDEARAMFGDAFQPGVASFLQVAEGGPTPRHSAAAAASERAYDALKKHARGTHSLRLARLAAQVRLTKTGHFDAVIASIDEMLKTLAEEGEADTKKRDQCKDEYKNIASTVADLEWKNEVSKAAIAKLEQQIAEAEEEKAVTLEHITDVENEMAEMTTTRQEENAKFLKAKSDDEAAIGILTQTKDALAAWYENHNESAAVEFRQRRQPEFEISADQAPDAEFTDHGHRDGEAKGIVSMISLLIEDLHGEIASGIQNEANAQVEYEKAMAVAQKLKETLEDKVTNLDIFISDRGAEKITEETTLSENEALWTDEKDYKKKITPDCDWIIGAWQKRRDHRQAEMEGLTQAKEFLAGAQ